MLNKKNQEIAGSKVMITGGAGFIGSHLVDRLIEHGAAKVIVLDNLSRHRVDWFENRQDQEKIEFILADILDKASWEQLLNGVDVIYHLAAVSRVMDAALSPEHTFLVNTLATIKLVEAATALGVRKFVFSSSREVYGEPTSLPVSENAPRQPKNIYGASKVAAEVFLEAFTDIDISILRLANVYGIGDQGRVIPLFLKK